MATSTKKSLQEKWVIACSKMEQPKINTKVDYMTKKGKIKYDYANLQEVTRVVRKALSEQGLGFTQYIKPTENGYFLQTAIFDNEDMVVLDERPITFGVDPKTNGALETYLKRYALNSVFGLAGEPDTDCQDVNNVKPPAPIKKPAPKKDKLTPVREAYKKALNCGVDKTTLDNVVDVYGKPMAELNDEQIKEVIEIYKRFAQEKTEKKGGIKWALIQ